MSGTGARAGEGARRSSALVACSLALNACGGLVEEPAPAQRDQSIIRGTLAASAELHHTGALVTIERDGEAQLLCTATLIAAETLVTAKHCGLALLQAEALGLGVAWLAGPSVAEPVELIEIVAAEPAPGNGRDVAVAHLDHASSFAPVEPQPLGDEMIGESLVSIGYGISSPRGAQDGRRRIGSETVMAVRGRAFEAIFGSFENFIEWYFTGLVTDANFLQGRGSGDLTVVLLLPELRSLFDSLLLLDGYEAVTGRAAGDSQTCSGDSGGPLARQTEDGSWQTFGVVSGGYDSAQSVCDFGTIFATFGPEVLAFLEQARGWVDPCGDVSAQGACQGAQAARCETRLLDGVRRPVLVDCAAAAQECVLGAAGPECRDPAPPPEPAEPVEPVEPENTQPSAPGAPDAGASTPAPGELSGADSADGGTRPPLDAEP